MDILYVAQTTFYLTFSLVVIAVGILFILITYNFLRLIRYLRHISRNLENASEEVRRNITEIIERLSKLPIFSAFVRHHSKKGQK